MVFSLWCPEYQTLSKEKLRDQFSLIFFQRESGTQGIFMGARLYNSFPKDKISEKVQMILRTKRIHFLSKF